MKNDNLLRVVLDTNIILASISRFSPYKKIIDYLFEGKFEIFVDNDMLLEYEEKISGIFSKEVSKEFIGALLILPNAYKIQSWYKLNLINTDPDDNKFVDCAFAANVNFIVSNDKHFTVLVGIEFPKITVIKIDDFIKILEGIK
jgi:uncharacterized protein